MINAYKEGKDLYATIASGIYKNDYWDNMETYQDGTPNPDGAARRSSVKSLLLGIMYGRGTASIAEQIHGTREDAQKIIDDFYSSYPKVKQWMDKTLEFAKKNGYVEDLWGRRRRLPELFLEKYSFSLPSDKNSSASLTMFNPFLICKNSMNPEIKSAIELLKEKLSKVKNRNEFKKIKNEAFSKYHLIISDNSGIISKSERECVNARIQGGAATMTKIAMIKIFNDPILKELGFNLLIGIHDELIGECPVFNASKVSERLTYVMRTCISDITTMPFKCDAEISKHWYQNEYTHIIEKEINSLREKKLTDDEIYLELKSKYYPKLLQFILTNNKK